MKKSNSIKKKLALLFISFFICCDLFGIDLKKFEDHLRLSMNLSVAGSQINENEKKINAICRELQDEYNKNHQADVLMFLKFFETARSQNSLDLNQKINNLLYIINKSDKQNVMLIAYANYGLSSLLIQNNSGEIGAEYSKNVLKLLEKEANIELEKLTYNQIGLINLQMKEFQEAKNNFYKAFHADKRSNNFFLATMLSNIAACDFETKNYREAGKLFQRGIDLLANSKSEAEQKYLAILKGNLGSIQQKLKKNGIAKENLWYEINYFCSRNLFLPFLNESFNDLLDIYLKESDSKGLSKIIAIINEHGKNQKELSAIFEYKKLLLKYSKKIGDQGRSQFIAEEIIDLQQKIKEDVQNKTKKVNSTFYSNKIDFINNTFNNEEIILNKELQQKKTIYSSIIIITVLISFSLLYILKQRNLKLKNIELINRQTTEIENAKRTIVEKELRLKKETVSNLSIFLNLKTETEKAFLKNLKDLKRKKNQDPESIFRELQNSVITLMNLDKSNLEIVNTIEQENAELIEKIQLKFPFLSKLECQLCSYFRLGLNSKEISSITNLTSGTIRVYKVKIKQKLKLNEEENLNIYLQELEDI